MGPSADEIDRKVRPSREQVDQDLDVSDEIAEADAARYGKIAAAVVGAVVVVAAGVLIYRRIRRPARREQLKRMLVEALEDLPDVLQDLPDELVRQIKRPLPSIQRAVNPEARARVRGALENVIRRVRD